MINSLNDLLMINIDASKGYSYAADHIKNDNFKHFLTAYARKREGYANELKTLITEMGGEPYETTTVLGDIHRGIMKIRESLSSSDDSALLEECVRGEGEAVAAYEKVLKADKLQGDAKTTVVTHLDKVRAAKGTMEELARVV